MTRCRLQAIVAADTIAFLLFGIWIERFESSFRARRLWYSVDMKGIKRLEKAEILKTAMRIVEGAKKSVKVTMLAPSTKLELTNLPAENSGGNSPLMSRP